ncbi:MAG: DUF86 domain-containing protein [Candidatus Taylorbacteria bacterium]|nr:DUF86 domain-containing protein [Candidatus Taylorbacteria bacterium]
MYKVPLSKTKIETKLAVIREAIFELGKLGDGCSQEEFVSDKEKFAVAEHYLRRALEAIFDIGGHIISRFTYSPGKRPRSIKEIALELGKRGIIDQKFAEDKLVEMAGYRNRLVHFYEEITPKELYQIITQNLNDLEIFARSATEVVNKPENVGLSIKD